MAGSHLPPRPTSAVQGGCMSAAGDCDFAGLAWWASPSKGGERRRARDPPPPTTDRTDKTNQQLPREAKRKEHKQLLSLAKRPHRAWEKASHQSRVGLPQSAHSTFPSHAPHFSYPKMPTGRATNNWPCLPPPAGNSWCKKSVMRHGEKKGVMQRGRPTERNKRHKSTNRIWGMKTHGAKAPVR